MWPFSRKKKIEEIEFEKYIQNERYRQFITNVSGISYDNTNGTSRRKIAFSCKKGDILKLERDDNNTHDKNAVKILNSRNKQLGFLSSYDAKNIAPILKGTSRTYSAVECRFIEAGYFETEDGREMPYSKISIRQYYKLQ